MRIFVSYSFRDENHWIESHVIPIVRSFGHEAVTGKVLEGLPIPEEVKRLISGCRRVLCFTTRGAARFGQNGAIVGYEPPDWVRDELVLARGNAREAIEFRESGVVYGGTSPFYAWHEFDRSHLADLLVDLAKVLAEWPVGPLQLRLAVPPALQGDIERATNAHTLTARCLALDDAGIEVSADQLKVRLWDGQLTVPFWVKPDPKLSIEIEINWGGQQLVCRGISPTVREARLQLV